MLEAEEQQLRKMTSDELVDLIKTKEVIHNERVYALTKQLERARVKVELFGQEFAQTTKAKLELDLDTTPSLKTGATPNA